MVRVVQKQSFPQRNPAKITSLPIFPRTYLHNGSKLEAELIDRGKRFLSYQGVNNMQCNGFADYLKEAPPDWWDPDMENFDLVWLGYTENGRVVLDRRIFQQDNYQDPVSPLAEVTDRDRVLQGESDQARKKGKGLVVLLHGPPGVGKTLTAECSAEATHRLLFSTSLQELNKYDRPYHFERELGTICRLATIWKAVILFDEADVFLESREHSSSSSGSRNALVAICLHHLEYFSGIVFLTTNLLRVFDKAMQSRLHLALGYAKPAAESRRRIWAQCLSKIPDSELDLNLDEALDALALENKNGREISNAVNTARTLSRFEKVKLSKAHLDSVLGVWQDFDMSLDRLRSQSTSTNANHGQHPHGHQLIRQGSILTEEPEAM